MANKQPTEQTTNKNLPTFVKQLLLLVLPTKTKNIINNSSNTNSNDSTSPFEKLYFSFPALDEDLVDANKNTSCGQHHQATHERSDVVKSTNNNGILC
jgi:hypothetical protein